MRIYSMVTKEKPEPSLWGKLFGSNDTKSSDQAESQKLYQELHGHSKDVVYYLDVLKEKIMTMAIQS
jgi:hypothetical protein